MVYQQLVYRLWIGCICLSLIQRQASGLSSHSSQILRNTLRNGEPTFRKASTAPHPTTLPSDPSKVTRKVAWILSAQLILVLKQEELRLEDADHAKQIGSMTRWLNTRLQYGCTALEYIEAAANQDLYQTSPDIQELRGDGFAGWEYSNDFEDDNFEFAENPYEEFQFGRPLEVIKSDVKKDVTSHIKDGTSSSFTNEEAIKHFFDEKAQEVSSTSNIKSEAIHEGGDEVSDSMEDKEDEVSQDDTRDIIPVSEVELVEIELGQEHLFFELDEKSSDDLQYSSGSEIDVLLSNKEDYRIRQAAAAISHSFQSSDFNPPLFTRNGHLQTVVAYLAREKNKVLQEFQWDERQRMATPDNDYFNVDWKYSDSEDRIGRPSYDVPLVLICHGLQSSSNSPQVKDMARAFNNAGMDVAAINFRGCCGELNNGPFGYHLSFTDDLQLMVEHVVSTRPGNRIYLSGFSLGANVVTKLLADLGKDAFLKYNICGAAVNALPFNITKLGPNLSDPGITKLLYGDGLLQSMTERVLKNFEDSNYGFTKEELLDCKTIIEFEDLAICNVYGFDGYRDYHEKSSNIGRLDHIVVPHLVIQALDDPFFEGNTNPQNDPSLALRVHYTEHGGHCGFFSPEEDNEVNSNWMPTELARFLKHIESQNAIQRRSFEESTHEKTTSAQRRKKSASISHSFQTREFSPVWYSTNPHFQTIMGTLFRQETMYASSDLPFLSTETSDKIHRFEWDYRQRMETPDLDFFDVDWRVNGVDFESEDAPLVLICHGLQTNSDSPLVKDMAIAFENAGMGVACINFRGCSGEVNRTPRSYHLGFTDDLNQMVDFVNSKYPGKHIYLSGFSLGANVVTKFLADNGDQVYDRNIRGAAVNAVPFDLTKSNVNLNQNGISKIIYGDRLLKSMYETIEGMHDSMDLPFPREKIRECKTIMDIEDLVITSSFSFDDAWDYYNKTSTLNILDKVSVPQLIIQSKDDPFMQGQGNPVGTQEWPLRLQYTDYGGHCGHILHSKQDGGYETSWMPTEMARFLSHIEVTLANDLDIISPDLKAEPVLQIEV